MINTVDCFAERFGKSMHLFVQGDPRLKVFQAAAGGIGVFGTIALAAWQVFVSLALMVLTSTLSAVQLWSYTVYVIPGAGKLAFHLLQYTRIPHNAIPIETVAPWVSIEERFGLTALLVAFVAWGALPTLVMGGVAKWYNSAADFPVVVHSLVLVCEAYSLLYLRSKFSIAVFPRWFGLCFMGCSLYALSFDYNGYWGLAILTTTVWMLALMAYLCLEHEIIAVIHGQLTQTKPRDYHFPVVVGLQNGAAPPLHTLFQLYSHLRVRYTEEARMHIEGTMQHRTQAGIWLGAEAEDARVEVVQEAADQQEEAEIQPEEDRQEDDFAPAVADAEGAEEVEMEGYRHEEPAAAAGDPGGGGGAQQAAANRKPAVPDVD